MKKILYLSALTTTMLLSNVYAEVVGVVDADKVMDSYSKVKNATDEISDKYAEIQRFGFDKEREYKKLSTPLERKNFEETTARELSKKQDALLRLKERKETEIDASIKAAIKQVALDNKIDTVVEKSVIFFGGIDITDKVIKQLNASK